MELPKKYNPQEIETKWQKYWDENKTFKFDADNTKKELYMIDTPPPTVSGKMHIGHAFSNSHQDFIARFKRMKGFNVLQPFGTDDNGLPTKLLIEKLKKVRAHSMDRSEFRNLCFDTLENELKPSYTNDWKRLGISCDFDAKYSTIDPHCRRISQESFIDLYNQGREYRAQAPAMHCPKCQTAISQVELEDVEKDSFFNDIIFKTTDEKGNEVELIIATTRPELLPACVSVFYHPEDTRYQHLKGKQAKIPLFDFEVPILEDERADPEKGTGLVMCCTFGDQTDMEWQKAHNLPIKEAINSFGKMTSLAGKYEGLKIENARKEIVEDLQTANLLKSRKPIKHAVNVHERCGTPVEFIHSKQWFIKYLDLKENMLEWGNQLIWQPEFMKNRYDNWVNGLAWDWCISRQLPFGISFPVWYCKDCDEVILARKEDLPVDPTATKPHIDKCPKCGGGEFVPETDVINTWTTSSMTPTIVKELFKNKPIYEIIKDRLFDLRPQAHDIISFWLFNTVVKSNLHYKRNPWTTCMISGWMLDPQGKKMAKSKGNTIEPREVIEKYSADALRFMAASTKLGEDLGYPEKEVVTGKKTVTKIFNASKFVHMHLEDYDLKENPLHAFIADLPAIDTWILAKYNHTVARATEFLEDFNFQRARAEIDLFFWRDLCDDYLEIVKHRLYDEENRTSRLHAQATLRHILFGVLRMFSPYVPFITEEVYSWRFKDVEKVDSIHLTSWPTVDKDFLDEDFLRTGELASLIIGAARRAKSDAQVSQKHECEKIIVSATEKEIKLLKAVEGDIKKTVSAKEISYREIDSELDESTNIPVTLAPKAQE